MKETFYFSHDYNARNDPKVLQLRFKFGWEGYGLYWALLETMAEDSTGHIHREAIGGLSVGYSVAIDTLKAFINYCVDIHLFQKDKDSFWSPRMVEHKKQRQAFVDAGRRGAAKRWKNSPPNSPPNSKERKGKEIIKKDTKEKSISILKKLQSVKIPDTLNNGKFVELWKIRSKQYYERMKSKASVSTHQNHLKKLATLPYDKACELVEEMIDGNWQGIPASVWKKYTAQKESSSFIPPTVEEIEDYMSSRTISGKFDWSVAGKGSLKANANAFINYYEAQGWKMANGMNVTDWEATIRKHEDLTKNVRKTNDED